eukprot:m.135254 g.135254  ORF g.135254 m.135254 type:complete len:449 (-) comp29784_c0_seq3:345-1691(-)
MDMDFIAPPQNHKAICVLSGGTGFNTVVSFLARLTPKVSYILPVSDDGGSTSEIMRVLGGPPIGDIRSRLLRLANPGTDSSHAAMSMLLHRLPSDEQLARHQWGDIIAGNHVLWNDVNEDFKHIMLGYLRQFEKLSSEAPLDFKYAKGSVGNFFFTAARVFFQSLPAAILLWKMIANIPAMTEVIPVCNSLEPLVLVAELDDIDTTLIVGQNAISHPTSSRASSPTHSSLPSSIADTKSSGNQSFSGGHHIHRMFYVDHENVEMLPTANPAVFNALNQSQVIVYAMGSLYTSLVAQLIIPGIGESIARKTCSKVLLLNGTYDRETAGLTATGFVKALIKAMQQHQSESSTLRSKPSDYVTEMLIPQGGQITIDEDAVRDLGISVTYVGARLKPTSTMMWERGPDGEPWSSPQDDNNDSFDNDVDVTENSVCFDEHALAAKLFEISKRN